MPSILFISSMNGGPWGGSEALWSAAAVRLASEGHEVVCAGFDWPEKAARWAALRSAGCTVLPLPNRGRRKRSLIERVVYEGFTKPVQTLSVRRLPWGRFDHVLVSQGAWDEVTTRPFRRLDALARSYSLAYHSYEEGGAPRRGATLARLARGARCNLFASERGREVLATRLGIELPNAALLYNPLSFPVPADESPWPPLDGAGAPLRLVTLGAVHYASKAQDLLLDALAGEAWRSRAWTLDVYGDGPQRADAEALARSLGLSDRVRLRGHTADVAGALARAHVLVQCSRVDAMPIAVHEAMAIGRAAVVTEVGDMPRWIRHGETGFVAARPERGEIARALEAVWEARTQLAEIGRRARAVFRARFPADPVGAFTRVLLEAARPAR